MDVLISRLDNTLKDSKNTPIAVFDIDSTIFNVSPRNQVILEAILKEDWLKKELKRESFDELKSKVLTDKDWGLEPLYQILSEELSSESIKQAKRFWAARFFTNEYLKHDIPYDFCIPFIQKLETKGFKIMYLTGRDNERMRAGTLNQLKKWELPLKEDSDLITKPNKGLIDGPYKQEALSKLMSPHHHLWFFDNEPHVLKYCEFKDQPNYQLVYIDSVHSKRAEPKETWLSLSPLDYKSLLEGI